MLTRIHVDPWTVNNETWASLAQIEFKIHDSYIDPLIQEGDETSGIHGSDKSGGHHYFEKVAMDIVTETVYDYPYPLISEKTWRAISWKRMFIIVGSPGSIRHLHSMGFKTFSPFIDESYDDITDPTKRMEKLIQEITRLCSIPLDEFKEKMLSFKDVLDHNKDLLNKIKHDDDAFKKDIKKQLCLS